MANSEGISDTQWYVAIVGRKPHPGFLAENRARWVQVARFRATFLVYHFNLEGQACTSTDQKATETP